MKAKSWHLRFHKKCRKKKIKKISASRQIQRNKHEFKVFNDNFCIVLLGRNVRFIVLVYEDMNI